MFLKIARAHSAEQSGSSWVKILGRIVKSGSPFTLKSPDCGCEDRQAGLSVFTAIERFAL